MSHNHFKVNIGFLFQSSNSLNYFELKQELQQDSNKRCYLLLENIVWFDLISIEQNLFIYILEQTAWNHGGDPNIESPAVMLAFQTQALQDTHLNAQNDIDEDNDNQEDYFAYTDSDQVFSQSNNLPEKIKIEFHPQSGKETLIQSLEEFQNKSYTIDPLSLDSEPWRPFNSRADFEFAEIALQGNLKKDQVEALLNLIKSVASGESKFTLTSYTDLKNSWAKASERLTPVSLLFI